MKTGGENFLMVPLALQITTKNPLGVKPRLVLLRSLSPFPDGLIGF